MKKSCVFLVGWGLVVFAWVSPFTVQANGDVPQSAPMIPEIPPLPHPENEMGPQNEDPSQATSPEIPEIPPASQPIEVCLEAVKPVVDIYTTRDEIWRSFRKREATEDYNNWLATLTGGILGAGVFTMLTADESSSFLTELNSFTDLEQAVIAGAFVLGGCVIGRICHSAYMHIKYHNTNSVPRRLREFAYAAKLALPAGVRVLCSRITHQRRPASQKGTLYRICCTKQTKTILYG